ncbi:hypothetical protein [Pseudonocardia humida]|uniref:Integral membrane protein n=1 Tax=Pseudonocardia humida TaxID=2800819 RepID=A0ABT0ZUI4_9PSEU|nr:hypothetical protein [Pseudonocardia humida]MCO1654384.1 hypothetical protein [Pseudonocardia humida]
MALTHRTGPHRPAPAPVPGPFRGPTLLPAAAATWSALAVLLGLWWWATGGYPFGPADPQGEGTVLGALPAAAGPPLLMAAGAVGVLVAVVAAVRAQRIAAGRLPGAASAVVVVATAVVYGIAFVLLAPGLSLLVLLGYLMAAFGPVVLLGTLLAGALRSRLAAAVAAVLVLVLLAAWVSGVADGAVVGRWAAAFGAGLARTAPRSLAVLFLAAGGALWLAVGWATARRASGGASAAWTRPAAAARWGRIATVIAVLCPLPYALLRATWLTPWPLGVPEGTELQVVGEMRLQGLLLGGAAVAGAVLTAGLVARWGEVWPRWMPGLRGRPVPVAAAAVPGALVALVICSAAVPMAAMAVAAGEPWLQLVFPLPVWGPALGAATLGYVLRRRGERERPGTIEGS